MSTAEAVFARHFPGLTPDEVDVELSRAPGAGATPISSSALKFLADHGGPAATVAIEQYDEAQVHHDRAVTSARTLEELLASSLTIEQSATSLGLSRSRISHRLRDRSLYAFTIQGRRYLPRWQFGMAPDGRVDGVLPGLAQLVPAIPRGVHPLAVQAVMIEPLAELDGKSPVDYLFAYGEVEVVVDWLTSWAHW